MSIRDVRQILSSATPEELEFPVPSTDHSDHVVWLALKGHTRIASDHLLHKEMIGHLEETVGSIIRALNIKFNNSMIQLAEGQEERRHVLTLARAYDLLLQTALNLFGLESRKIVGFLEEEIERTLQLIRNTLESWEMVERRRVFGEGDGKAPIARFVVEEILSEMKKVMSEVYREPGSMLSHLAWNIKEEIEENSILLSFLNGTREQIQENIYYKMAEREICKFGNDYALGLRWLRHIGYVQVSTNPSLAAIAYEDEPSLWKGYKTRQFGAENLCIDLESISKEHPDWRGDPERHGDEIAAYGTEVAIWPNLAIFRPTAIASDMFHGMISLQLNPNIADDYEKSIRNAFKIYSDAEKFFKKYDRYLLWGYSKNIERGRPNIVFKVAGSSPTAIEITTVLESHGIGTNNTVTFAVSQETRLILAKIEGRAQAKKRGILPTTVYETNMGGRLDDHIREYKAERLLKKALAKVEDKDKALEELAEKLGALKDVKKTESMDEKIRTVCHRRYLRPINKEPFIDLLAGAGILGESKEVAKRLSELERSIGYGGVCVTKRVHEIFFSSENRSKWLVHIQSKYGLTRDQADKVLRGIHVLPASKRKPAETLETIANEHMVHTEFPNHQKNVFMRSKESDFRMEEYRNSVMEPPNQELLTRLLDDEDVGEIFRGAWELTPYLVETLKEAGITDAEKKYGTRGLRPSEWAELGSTKKTMLEFSNSYEKFKKNCVEHVRKWLEEDA